MQIVEKKRVLMIRTQGVGVKPLVWNKASEIEKYVRDYILKLSKYVVYIKQ